MDIILIIVGIVVGIGIYILGRQRGKKVIWDTAYYAGRHAGWKDCENLLIDRMIKSEHIDLTRREILDEFIC